MKVYGKYPKAILNDYDPMDLHEAWQRGFWTRATAEAGAGCMETRPAPMILSPQSTHLTTAEGTVRNILGDNSGNAGGGGGREGS